MRSLIGGIGMGLLLLLAHGCGKSEANPTVKAPPKKDPYVGWPKDTIPKPDDAGTVEYTASREPADAEALRVGSTFLLPDWAKETAPITYRSPKGAKLEVHFLQRDEALRKSDDEKIQKLLSGAKDSQSYLVVARPWRGWYGEANSARAEGIKALPCRMRIYSLFQQDRYLELHLEWPKESPKAKEEGELMAGLVMYSIKDLKSGKSDG
jgi:hypothetical protein